MGNFITSGAAVRKAGNNVDISQPDDFWTESISGAEATVRVACRNDFATTNANSQLVNDTTARLVAIDAWTYKPTGSDGNTNRIEFEDRINILRDGAIRGLSILRDKKQQDFIG